MKKEDKKEGRKSIHNDGITIEEIGAETLKRVEGKSRIIPIKLHDGKIIEREPDQVFNSTSEYSSTSHQEFVHDPNNLFSKKLKNSEMLSTEKLPSRIIPITLTESGESLQPKIFEIGRFRTSRIGRNFPRRINPRIIIKKRRKKSRRKSFRLK